MENIYDNKLCYSSSYLKLCEALELILRYCVQIDMCFLL